MKKYKEIVVFLIIMYTFSVIAEIILNKFSFNTEYLSDSIFNAVGVTLGWYGYEYIHKKINLKKKVNKNASENQDIPNG